MRSWKRLSLHVSGLSPATNRHQAEGQMSRCSADYSWHCGDKYKHETHVCIFAYFALMYTFLSLFSYFAHGLGSRDHILIRIKQHECLFYLLSFFLLFIHPNWIKSKVWRSVYSARQISILIHAYFMTKTITIKLGTSMLTIQHVDFKSVYV